MADRAEDYQRLGLNRDEIEPWEDGLRTHGGRGTYEWWYFDAHLDDGSKLVIVFYTKPLADVGSPLLPHIAITLDNADGSHRESKGFWRPDEFSASRERCHVRIAENVFEGDQRCVRIVVNIDGLRADITLVGTIPPWRPATGHLLFEPDLRREFAWLPWVPQGRVEGEIAVDGLATRVTGVGYHDHNWGNYSIARLLHHWYWARGSVGPYCLIASHITAERRYGGCVFPVFMLARDGRIIADQRARVEFTASGVHVDHSTGKPVADITRYECEDGDQRYRITFERRSTILRMKLIETLPRFRRLLARLARFDGAFLRFTGTLRLERYEADRLAECFENEAIWELMYFGHPDVAGELDDLLAIV